MGISKTFAKLDSNSKPFQLSIDGSASFKTVTGAVITLTMMVIIFVYGVIQLKTELTKPYTFQEKSFLIPQKSAKLNLAEYGLFPYFSDEVDSFENEDVKFSGNSGGEIFNFQKCSSSDLISDSVYLGDQGDDKTYAQIKEGESGEFDQFL